MAERNEWDSESEDQEPGPRRRNAQSNLPESEVDQTKRQKEKKIVKELIEVVSKHAMEPLLKQIKHETLANFRIEKKLQQCPAEKYILDHNSGEYKDFMKYCKEKFCEDYLRCFTHFKTMVDEMRKNFKGFMEAFDVGLRKYLKPSASHLVSLGNHAYHLNALNQSFETYWNNGNPQIPSKKK